MRKLLMQMQWKSVAVVLIAGAVLLLTQSPLAAQEAPAFDGQIVLAQARPNDQQDLGRAEQRILPFVLLGGSFQLVDNTGAPCTGQCLFPNALTATCACPEGFIEVDSARILVDVPQPEGPPLTCGSTLVMCLR